MGSNKGYGDLVTTPLTYATKEQPPTAALEANRPKPTVTPLEKAKKSFRDRFCCENGVIV